MAKSGNMNMRVTPAFAEALHRAAVEDNRTDRDKATLIVDEWLLEHGYYGIERAAEARYRPLAGLKTR